MKMIGLNVENKSGYQHAVGFVLGWQKKKTSLSFFTNLQIKQKKMKISQANDSNYGDKIEKSGVKIYGLISHSS